jgi:uncharacterized coiled-coil protein SlyX
MNDILIRLACLEEKSKAQEDQLLELSKQFTLLRTDFDKEIKYQYDVQLELEELIEKNQTEISNLGGLKDQVVELSNQLAQLKIEVSKEVTTQYIATCALGEAVDEMKESCSLIADAVASNTEYRVRSTSRDADNNKRNTTSFAHKNPNSKNDKTTDSCLNRNVYENAKANNIVIHGLGFHWKAKNEAKLSMEKFLKDTLTINPGKFEVFPLGNRSSVKPIPYLVKFRNIFSIQYSKIVINFVGHP